MIDIENMVFSKVKDAVVAKFESAEVKSTYITDDATFPCVDFVETNNTVYTKTTDMGHIENHAELLYECNIYTEGDGMKQQAKAIAQVVDLTMQRLGFHRTFMRQTPNIERNIYRLTLRFKGITDKGKPEGEDVVYHIV